ncbi:uncharacterized protein LOC144433390 [Glandiceps talaboti]
MAYVSFHELSPSTIRHMDGNRLLPYFGPIGMVLNVLVVTGLLWATIADHWAESNDIHLGLWRVCHIEQNQQRSNCSGYYPAPAHIQVCRIFMVSACFLSIFTLACAGYAIFTKNTRKVCVASGFLILADVFSTVSSITFAALHLQYYRISYCVIIVWVSIPVAVLSSVLFLIGCYAVHRPLLNNANYKAYGCMYSRCPPKDKESKQ